MSQTSMSEPPQIKSRIGAILRATSGNFLEQFDFFLFGFYASYIAKVFFPSENETAALLNAFGVFWLGALMRPVGAIVLGAYIDRIGRRKGLIVTLAIMAVGTVTIAVCPTYASIGIAAPVVVLIGRCLGGFSAGVELGGVSVYLAEISTPGNRGFYTSFQSASQQVAIFVAAIIGYALNEMMPAATLLEWGWRDAGGHDHGDLLFCHRLYADLRQERAEALHAGQPAGHLDGRGDQLHLESGWRRRVGPHRTQAGAAGDRRSLVPDRLSGAA